MTLLVFSSGEIQHMKMPVGMNSKTMLSVKICELIFLQLKKLQFIKCQKGELFEKVNFDFQKVELFCKMMNEKNTKPNLRQISSLKHLKKFLLKRKYLSLQFSTNTNTYVHI